jgi:hypothetical protein
MIDFVLGLAFVAMTVSPVILAISLRGKSRHDSPKPPAVWFCSLRTSAALARPSRAERKASRSR